MSSDFVVVAVTLCASTPSTLMCFRLKKLLCCFVGVFGFFDLCFFLSVCLCLFGWFFFFILLLFSSCCVFAFRPH